MTDVERRSASEETPLSLAEWTTICPLERLPFDRGVGAIIDGEPIAVFRLSPSDEPSAVGSEAAEEILAVSHIDPVSGSPVMARGLVGSFASPPTEIPTLASPLHKQRYNLRTGDCLDDETLRLRVFDVRVIDGIVMAKPAPS